jgi:hypothetical protein
MKSIDQSFRHAVLDRLPQPRMEGVGFGILHMQPGEHVEFGAQQYSWFFQVRRGAMEVRFRISRR